ncbi:MAG: hypothetical protein G5663_00030 [Serratia symbiotica]|nr:hypothetical protein [Serratia symbiotica]
MYRVQQLFGSHLSLQEYDAQDDDRRYTRKCRYCLKDAHSVESLFQIRFIQQR